MINDQIVLWIIKNQYVYVQAELRDRLIVKFDKNFDSQLTNLLQTYIIHLANSIKRNLLEKRAVLISNLALFYVIQKDAKRWSGQYIIDGTLANKIANKPQFKVVKLKQIVTNISHQIASLMLIEAELLQQLQSIWTKAINDLILAGKSIELDLQFAKFILNRKESVCRYRKSFINELNTQSIADEKENYKLCLNFQKHRHCQKATNIQAMQRIYNQEKWEQIKEGNLFNHPNLAEIKTHLDKGRALQLQYMQLYD